MLSKAELKFIKGEIKNYGSCYEKVLVHRISKKAILAINELKLIRKKIIIDSYIEELIVELGPDILSLYKNYWKKKE